MPPGRTPKDPRLLQRVNRHTTARTLKATARPKRKAPPLPVRGKKKRWHPRTVAWWRDLWRSPVATCWLAVDIHPLVRLAELWDEYHRVTSVTGRISLSREIRLAETRWGLDEASRRSLQIRIEPEPDAVVEDAPDVVDPRQVLRAVK